MCYKYNTADSDHKFFIGKNDKLLPDNKHFYLLKYTNTKMHRNNILNEHTLFGHITPHTHTSIF